MSTTTTPRVVRQIVALVLAGVAALAALAGCSTATTSPGHGSEHMPAMSHTDAGADANAADVMFARMMIPHHEQAIEMAEIVLAKDGIDSRVVELAGQIRAAQAPEIDEMTTMLESWGQDPGMPAGDHAGHGMSGMLSDAELDSMRAAEPSQAQQLFLAGMIEHHQGAIDMAETVLEDGRNAGVGDLARRIIDAQQAEITAMQELIDES